jgi:1-acyl-sn-glycerol-3-phosphate acyltransferase
VHQPIAEEVSQDALGSCPFHGSAYFAPSYLSSDVNHLRSCYRIPGFLVWTALAGGTLALVRLFTRGNPHAMHRMYLIYIAGVQRLMGIRVRWEGAPPEGPSLLMGNHRSYVDAVLMPAKHPVAFVARSESRNWPIIGWGASALKTIWVNRKDRESRRNTRFAVRERLDAGMGIVVFPEGTTHRGPELGPYRPSMFAIAADGGFPITPIAIEYRDPSIAWVGDDTFIPHAWKHLGKRWTDVTVCFGETFVGTDPEENLRRTREWTAAQVDRIRAEYDANAC